ncbi:MAG: hypothetical protein LH619_06515, partial [Chitinophagaceae bacterium]|nr:hypothetical protein [Chitinophagaceae bacterium]
QRLPTIEEKTKDLKKYEGFMNFYWDENTGKIWLEIDKLDTEVSVANGTGIADLSFIGKCK